MCLDTYNVVSGGKSKPVFERYKCNNMTRHVIVYCSRLEGNYSIDEFVKSSEKIQNIIRLLNSFDSYGTRELIEQLREKPKEDFLNKCAHNYDKIFKINYSGVADYTPNRIFEMRILSDCHNAVYFEDFNNDIGDRSFKTINIGKYIFGRKPMEEECKIKLEDKAFLIEKVKNSSRTDQDKLSLIDKINSNKLDEADELLLEDEIKSDIIKRTNETINKINLLSYNHYCLTSKRGMNGTIKISEEDKINLNAINKINESTADELEKMGHLDLDNLDVTTKLTLIEIISSAKFDEQFKNKLKNNLIDKIKKINESELDEIKTTKIIDASHIEVSTFKLSKELLIQLVETDNLEKLQNYTYYHGLKKYIVDECNILSDIKSCQKYLINAIKSNILKDTKMWNRCFTSILDPEDQEHKSIFDFKELFGDTSKEQLKCEVYESAIPRIPNWITQGDREFKKAILEAVMTHYTVRETMEDVHIYGDKTRQYHCCDGTDLKVPYRSKIENLRGLKGATEEMNKELQLGLKIV